MRIVADDKIPFLKGVLEPLAEVVYLPGDQISNAALKNTDALLTRSITNCNAELLDNTTVKFIASATIGDDHIDKKYCKENSIKWTTAKGCNANAVMQYVSTALLLLAQKNNIVLKNQTLGIIGVGNIGSKLEKLAGLLGMNVLLNDPPRARIEGGDRFVSLNNILEKADIITFHVPLIKKGEDKTFHLADEKFFQQLKKKCILINTSRGNVVETHALIQAIDDRIVKYAIVDVWENEPEINKGLLDLVHIATAHIAGYSIEGKAKGTAMTVQALSNFFNLSIDNWFPQINREKKIIEFDGYKLSDQEIVYEIFNQAYPIQNDDAKLKNNLMNFEKLRREYVFRQENNSFILNLKNVKSEVIYLLENLGFIIQKNN